MLSVHSGDGNRELERAIRERRIGSAHRYAHSKFNGHDVIQKPCDFLHSPCHLLSPPAQLLPTHPRLRPGKQFHILLLEPAGYMIYELL